MKNANKYAEAFASLDIPSIELDAEFNPVDVNISPTVHVSRDSEVILSAEEGDGLLDYYGEFRGGYPYIHPAIEAKAKELGGHLEWINAGAVGFFI